MCHNRPHHFVFIKVNIPNNENRNCNPALLSISPKSSLKQFLNQQKQCPITTNREQTTSFNSNIKARSCDYTRNVTKDLISYRSDHRKRFKSDSCSPAYNLAVKAVEVVLFSFHDVKAKLRISFWK